MARSPVLSQSQAPAKPPLTPPPGTFDESFGNQAWSIPDFHTRMGYNQHLEQGIDSPSTPGGNVRLCFPHNANTFSSDVCPSQVSQQQWELEGFKEARQDLDPGRTWKNRSKTPRGVHRCTNCSKAYQRHQDLKRHTRDKHEWLRKCPFCCTRWSRPERIRAHLMKKHQEIRLLRGRDDTIHFLKKYENTTPPGNYMPDWLTTGNPISYSRVPVVGVALVKSSSETTETTCYDGI
ncbi:hypothetical protein H4582DRAFT_2053835 [Lactarius indigo]|nr:hypothetical protein H4582DRAFT_2053835 [Lactarius indigo]